VEAPPRGRLPAREFSAEFLRLREDALVWIGDYYDGERLLPDRRRGFLEPAR